MSNNTVHLNLVMANVSHNATSVAFLDEDLFPTSVDYIMKVLYVLVASLGILGNGLVLHLFASRRVKLTPFNILLLNLTLSDLLGDISIWPYVFISLKSLRGFSKTTASGLCIIVMGQMTYWIATVAALFTLTVISVSRYIFIRYPLKSPLFLKKHAVYVILVIWPSAVAMCLPTFFSFVYNYEYAVCERKWPQGVNGQVYSSITAVLGYIIPILVLTFTFIGTRQFLWLARSNEIVRSSSSMRRRKTASMLLGALVLAFFVCWSPFFVYWILSRTATTIFPVGPEGDYSRMRVIVFVVFISLLNTVADPLIYGLRSDDFRKSLHNMWDGMVSGGRERARTKSSECPDSRCDDNHIRLQR